MNNINAVRPANDHAVATDIEHTQNAAAKRWMPRKHTRAAATPDTTSTENTGAIDNDRYI